MYVCRKSEIQISFHETYRAMTTCFHSKKPAWPSRKSEILKLTSNTKGLLYPWSALMHLWQMQLTPFQYQVKNPKNGFANLKTAPLLDLLERKWGAFLENWSLWEKPPSSSGVCRAFEMSFVNCFFAVTSPLWKLSCWRSKEWGRVMTIIFHWARQKSCHSCLTTPTGRTIFPLNIWKMFRFKLRKSLGSLQSVSAPGYDQCMIAIFYIRLPWKVISKP